MAWMSQGIVTALSCHATESAELFDDLVMVRHGCPIYYFEWPFQFFVHVPVLIC